MDLDWLKDFLALSEQGSFSRAAEVRNVTQPAFSRRIRALEDWTGTALFVRSAQGATLTLAGQHLRPLAHDMLRSLDQARRDTRAVGNRATSSLSFAATHALSYTFFPSWIRQHVDLDAVGTLNLISDSMDACAQIMLGGEVHFLLCHHHDDAPVPFDPARFARLCLGHDTLVAVSAPHIAGRPMWALPDKSRKPTRILAYGPASGLGRILASQPSLVRLIAQAETVFTSHLAATLLTMTLQGEGVAWLPLAMATDDLERGRLIRAGTEDTDVPVEIVLVRSPDCRNQAADRFWDAFTTPDSRT